MLLYILKFLNSCLYEINFCELFLTYYYIINRFSKISYINLYYFPTYIYFFIYNLLFLNKFYIFNVFKCQLFSFIFYKRAVIFSFYVYVFLII